ncbi:hypothetical protein BS78_02G114400 [Paspalum vaginatum]|nr:hypothetical protein BS78_02G114400 [Paspalum vaginatum]
MATMGTRSGAPCQIYGAITTCSVHDGRGTSFWFDAWCGPDDLATRFPTLSLASHCTKMEVSIRAVMERGPHNLLVNRLSAAAQEELQAPHCLLPRATSSRGMPILRRRTIPRRIPPPVTLHPSSGDGAAPLPLWWRYVLPPPAVVPLLLQRRRPVSTYSGGHAPHRAGSTPELCGEV